MEKTIEDVRNYWDRRPCNIMHSNAPIGTEEYFDQVTERKYLVEPHILRFANFKECRGKRVLEIGCGIGTDAVRFAVNGAIYTGIDISPASVELAKKRFELLNLSGRFIVGDAENLDALVPDRGFDLVYAFGSIHHTPNPSSIVGKVKDFLLPDSEFRLMLYAKNSWKDIMIEAELDQFEAQSGCPVVKTFTREEARELLSEYDIISMEQTHIFPYVIEDYVQHRYTIQPWFDVMPLEMFDALERRLGWHLLIVAKLKQSLDKSPLRA